MNKKIYDKLDKFFQSRLKGENLNSDSWNTPPADLLTNALDSIKGDKKRKKRRIFIWILTGMLLLSLLFINLNNYHKITNLEHKIEYLQSINDTNDKATSEKNKENNIFEWTQLEHLSRPTSNTINSWSGQRPNDETFIPEQKQSVIDNDDGAPLELNFETSNTKERRAQEVLITDTLAIDKKEVLSEPVQPIAILVFNPIVQLKGVPLFFGEDLISLAKSQKKKALSPFAYFGYQMSSVRMTNPGIGSFSLTGYDHARGGYFGGVGLDYSLNNRFSLRMKVGFSCVQSKSTFEDEIIYDQANEFVDNQGNRKYVSDFDVESVMGRHTSDLIFDLGGMALNHNDRLNNQTQIHEKFKILNLGFSTQYQVVNFQKFKLFLEGGMNANYLIGMNEDMGTLISHGDIVMMKKDVTHSSLKDTNRLYFSLFGNVGLSYDLTSSLRFGFSTGPDYAISSIRKSNIAGDAKTYLNNNKMALSFAYMF